MLTRQVTWGEALYLEVKKMPGGLKGAHDVLAEFGGKHIDTRNTYAKLFNADAPEALTEPALLRAWLLLVALGLNPADWDVPESAVPDFMVSPVELRRRIGKIRESRLGESNPRPIHYKWTGRKANASLLRRNGTIAS